MITLALGLWLAPARGTRTTRGQSGLYSDRITPDLTPGRMKMRRIYQNISITEANKVSEAATYWSVG